MRIIHIIGILQYLKGKKYISIPYSYNLTIESYKLRKIKRDFKFKNNFQINDK